MPSLGSLGDAFDNAIMESFGSSMQIEPLDRQRRRTRFELSNTMFDYIKIFCNRQRRDSSLNFVSPVEFEASQRQEQLA